MEKQDFFRLVNNFYAERNMAADVQRMNLDAELLSYIADKGKEEQQKYKVAFLCICLNEPYWPFAKEMMDGAREFFLPGHQTDFFFWSDMPESHGATLFTTEPAPWPYPTLLRYNLFLQQEEILKDYDYIFYCDVDMKFVNIVGDEILSDGITAAQHPMYAVRKEYWPPYEPNPDSASYIKRPGQITIDDQGKPRFMPLYFAGGFQGGKASVFIEAMKYCKRIIEEDMNKAYIPIWNDESAWNKYLSEYPPERVLTPSYIYPDSLIKEYYEPLWGCSYPPKLMTLTKKFTASAEGAQALNKMLQEIKPLQ